MDLLELAADLSELAMNWIEEGLLDDSLYLDLIKVLHAVTNDRVVTFYADDALIELFWEAYNDEHPIWNHLELET